MEERVSKTRKGLIDSANFFWSKKNVRIENVINDLFYESTNANWPLMAWVLSDDVYRMPVRSWNFTGGFKRLYKLSPTTCRLIVQPCNNFRVLSMTIREALLQNYLSNIFDFVPKITSMRLVRSGILSVPIYEVILDMQYLAETLLSWLSTNKDPTHIIQIFIEILESLCKLREAGIRHNDLKPDNIMIHDGKVFFIDYGLATLESEEQKGCDLFFFSWFAVHRIGHTLPEELLDHFKRSLRIPLSEISPERLAKLNCQRDRNFIYLDRPIKRAGQTWVDLYGIDKQTLYQLSHTIQDSDAQCESFLKKLKAEFTTSSK